MNQFILLSSILTINILFTMSTLMAQEVQKIYLLPGQGGDGRLFDNLDLSPFEVQIINYSDTIPVKGETLPEYAARIAQEIDTTENYALLGVSFGGMISVEISELLGTEKLFLVSSAKNRNELAGKLNFARKTKLHKVVSGKVSKGMGPLVRPLFEPSIRKNKDLFNDMLKQKSHVYLKRAIHMMVEWERIENPTAIVHIHGNKDNTLPISWVKDPIVIEGGTHMMTYFRADEIRDIVFEHIAPKALEN